MPPSCPSSQGALSRTKTRDGKCRSRDPVPPSGTLPLLLPTVPTGEQRGTGTATARAPLSPPLPTPGTSVIKKLCGQPVVPPAPPLIPRWCRGSPGDVPSSGEMPSGDSGHNLHHTRVTRGLLRIKTSCFFQHVGVRCCPGRGAKPCAVSRVPEARTQLGLQQLPGNKAPAF